MKTFARFVPFMVVAAVVLAAFEAEAACCHRHRRSVCCDPCPVTCCDPCCGTTVYAAPVRVSACCGTVVAVEEVVVSRCCTASTPVATEAPIMVAKGQPARRAATRPVAFSRSTR